MPVEKFENWLIFGIVIDMDNSLQLTFGPPFIHDSSATFDQAVAGSTAGLGVIKSPRPTQPSIPPGYVNRVPWLGLRRGVFACVGWQV